MSKQSENKEKQGFQKEHPSCVNCANFTSEMKQHPGYRGIEVLRETNLRCSIGGFKVGRSNWCQQHKFK